MSDTPPLLGGDHHALGGYARELADRMGMRDWTVRVDAVPADDDNAGECRVTYGQRRATLRVSADWATRAPDDLRNTICHELLHCHLEPVTWAINNGQVPLGSTAFVIFEGAFRDAMELAVDGIATAWAETLPLPVRKADAGPEGDAS